MDDDGSTADAEDLLKEYATKGSRYPYFKTPNTHLPVAIKVYPTDSFNRN